ncbi:CMGC family protein kinase [Tritrichomonas foetus]|uniref:CMGC family protein kinase n=1 Tax=Tritrichomonas foetus TaxID=1144522 RepID=A0A1J4KYE0_9EUKA|nr:CMGC family protein kinase [Tritrichomonas foetus]|eukprot:OHT14724.1 CMGC family protein kinase [Tritrichomonas foetus]
MSDLILEDLTLYIKETFNEISPQMYPPPSFAAGRPLNPPEEEDPLCSVSSEGHKIVFVNEVFEDDKQHKYRVIDTIGSGTFSYVFKCQDLQTKKFVAMKVIKNLQLYYQTGLGEIMIHQLMAKAPDHPGKSKVMNPLNTFEIDNHVCIVMPLMYRSLFEGISQTQSLLDLLQSIRNIMYQLLQGLDFIHQNGITHCDLKPDNILFIDDDFKDILLIDFGSASLQPAGALQYIQSRFYRSPEVMLGLPFDSQIDIWSAGCVAAELFLDFAVFACDNEFDAIHSMVGVLGQFPENLLSKSAHWQRFFDIERGGFVTKSDPSEILLNKHSYHQKYQQMGAVPLRQLINIRANPQTPEEVAQTDSFSHFVHCLLEYDQMKRLTAKQALGHPFLEGKPITIDWKPIEVKRLPPNPPKDISEGGAEYKSTTLMGGQVTSSLPPMEHSMSNFTRIASNIASNMTIGLSNEITNGAIQNSTSGSMSAEPAEKLSAPVSVTAVTPSIENSEFLSLM